MFDRLRLRAIRSLAVGMATLGFAAGAATTPGAAADLDAALRKQLDTFFSNFSEAGLPNFEAGRITDDQLLDFAIEHLYDNDRKALKIDAATREGTAPGNLVDKITIRYFDQRIETDRADAYGMEVNAGASDDTYVFSEIGTLKDIGGGLFAATGSVYETAAGHRIDPHAKPADWAKAGLEVDRTATFKATIKAIENRYVLVEYQQTDVP